MIIEIPIQEQIEAARAKLKTAYDRWKNAPADLKESLQDKLDARRTELNQLLNKTQLQP